jgi:myosin-crossreactive antigen
MGDLSSIKKIFSEEFYSSNFLLCNQFYMFLFSSPKAKSLFGGT